MILILRDQVLCLKKKNPDIAELIRAKTGRVYASLFSLLVTMKGLALAYNKDMQEDKELSFDCIDTISSSLILMRGMLESIKFNKDIMLESAKGGFTNATDAADYLVKKGLTFRDAHSIIGSLVLYAEKNNKSLDDLSLDEFKSISKVFEEDIYYNIDLNTCINKRNTLGAPSPDSIQKQIEEVETLLD